MALMTHLTTIDTATADHGVNDDGIVAFNVMHYILQMYVRMHIDI